jgi:hypothetical protein
MDAAREAKQAAALAAACASAGVSHAVWSTLEDTRAFEKPGERMPALGPKGEYCVPHFDEKGAADERFRAAGVPTTFLRTFFFFEARAVLRLHACMRGDAMRRMRCTPSLAHHPIYLIYLPPRAPTELPSRRVRDGAQARHAGRAAPAAPAHGQGQAERHRRRRHRRLRCGAVS